jgi:hypothetical protein
MPVGAKASSRLIIFEGTAALYPDRTEPKSTGIIVTSPQDGGVYNAADDPLPRRCQWGGQPPRRYDDRRRGPHQVTITVTRGRASGSTDRPYAAGGDRQLGAAQDTAGRLADTTDALTVVTEAFQIDDGPVQPRPPPRQSVGPACDRSRSTV